MLQLKNPLASKQPFANMPLTPATHFKLYFYAAVSKLLSQLIFSLDSLEAVLERFPFLSGYYQELEAQNLTNTYSNETWWQETLTDWQKQVEFHLPLLALQNALELDHNTLTLLAMIGLIEEDVRFGSVFEAMQGLPGQARPTLSLLNTWWQQQSEVSSALRVLQAQGIVTVNNPEAPRMHWALQIPEALWDALKYEFYTTSVSWVHYKSISELLSFDELILPADLKSTLETSLALIKNGEISTLVVRGPKHNGRKTLLGALAKTLGLGLLEFRNVPKSDDKNWQLLGPLTTALNALPVTACELSAGGILELSPLLAYKGPLGIVLGRQGAVHTGQTEALSFNLGLPDSQSRKQHWQAALGTEANGLAAISERFRLTSGNIKRTASLARTHARLAGRESVNLEDIWQASRNLNRETLETLATHISTTGNWGQLAVNNETQEELRNLENRCRYREELRETVNPAFKDRLNVGVRALFSGPSGTGKTLAAQLLASSLSRDLYRLDLSSVVNKYIGETEKNLSRLFDRAEELDVILLLDEGDALLTQRTDVQTANDRYANLETNYLLQRLESFEGILVITTNASQRIDSAFKRRIDVVIDFRAPEPNERWAIWQLHLPTNHAVEQKLLTEVASRCNLTGGQIRNAALHASLLALQDGGVVVSQHLDTAVRREYRKLGQMCPLRQS